jgi:cyanophycin synthetase
MISFSKMADEMKITKEATYDHPNLILPVPTICLLIERDGGLGDLTLSAIADAAQRIGGAIPSLSARLSELASEIRNYSTRRAIATCIAETALLLHNDLFLPAAHALGLAPNGKPEIVAAFEFRNFKLGLLAGRAAVALWDLALSNPAPELDGLADINTQLRKDARGVQPRLGTRYLLEEAARRDIPSTQLLDLKIRIKRLSDLFQFGQGCKQKRFMRGITSNTASLAYELTTFKPATAHLLAEHGIPVPPQGVADTWEQAIAIGQQIGFPLVVKPIDQDMGAGVLVAISDEAALQEAFTRTRRYGVVQIEKYITGFDHRITFIDNVLVSVLRTTPPIIVGDGKTKIQQLLEADRIATPSMIKGKITIDDEVLGRVRDHGYAPDDILPSGQEIVLRLWWRNALDHALEDVTPLAHPDNIEVARRAVQLIGIDVAGVDFLTLDISRPYYETGAAITEVNAMPALAGVQGCGRPAYSMLFDSLFPQGSDGRIPTALVLDERDDGSAVAMTEKILGACGLTVGVSSRHGIRIAGKPIRREVADDTAQARLILQNPQVSAAILQISAETIRRRGLPIDKADVAVLMPPDKKAKQPTETADKLVNLLRATARKAVVLNCRDPRGPALLSLPGRLIWIVDEFGAGDCEHRRDGDSAVALRKIDGHIFICVVEGRKIRKLAEAPRNLTKSDGSADRRTVLTAIGLAHGLELPLRDIAVFMRKNAAATS